ncbi:DUF3332 domain-containing protein [Shewanella acanthi]|uniref:DUF3332 domain-containing protein n=1 Tax=Shewanella acanthi TaxID=2864212 RepID=UPI001C658C51|nr:DUF3332 domain-containing protein [Shewanella acanthi]QYJ77521.1 DUF3332 domain-containing protein [Shewanella acanthi]
MKKMIIRVCLLGFATSILSGCVGSNAVTGYVMQFNLQAVDNRYARGGLNILMAPVYGISIAADYIVFNSLEFWTGHNPLNGKPHIFDTHTDTYIDINDKVHDSLKTAPVKPLTNNRIIHKGQMQQIDENTVRMDITYNNGETAILTGERNGNLVTYYIDGKVVSQTSIEEMQDFLKSRV